MKHVDSPTLELALTPFTVADAERVLAGEVDPVDGWEGGYSFTDEPELVAEFVRAVHETGDPAPYGPYLVRRGPDGPAIGGVNLFGPPDHRGVVEFAFGLVPAVRGRGLALDVVASTLALLRANGALVARAESEIANLPARRVLEQSGMAEVDRSDEFVVYEVRL